MTIYKYWDRSATKIAVGPMDQRARVESRKDHVAYSTEPLEKDVVVRDVVKMKLHVSSDRVDTDFAVRLCDVYPDGHSMLITDGIHRMRFRESLEKEKFMKPGEVYEVTVILTPTAHTFLKKHRIRILVSSSNYPRFDRNPNNGEHFLTDKKKALAATNKVYHDASHLSALILPVPGTDKGKEPSDSSQKTGEEDARERLAQSIYEYFEKDCIRKGWKKVLVKVGELERKLLWKGPEGAWKNGAIIALHGGGGACSNWGSGPRIGKPIDEFGDFVIKHGFAVFALDSTDGKVTDSKGRSCGKRWDCLAQDERPNVDLPFIKAVITETIPKLRPASSAGNIFMTGISNGGYMTILTATYLPDKITAFAPVSAGDPYETYFDMGTHPEKERHKAPGVFRDCETDKLINQSGAARAETYPNEKKWPETKLKVKPPFKQFHHQGDGVCDISCMEKARSLLVKHGYTDNGPFIIKDTGARTLLKHFWKKEYNQPLVDFFINCRQIQPGLHERTVDVNKNKRKYLLYVPKLYDGKKAVPVVMMLHGGGGTGKAAMEETGWDKKAEKERFLAVFPTATRPDPKKPPKFSTNSPTWNDGSGRFHAGKKNVPDVKYLIAVLDDIASSCSIDDKRIYVTGFSNGASMTFRAGAELSDRIAAIAPLAGAFWLKDVKLKRAVPALYITGTADTLNPLRGGFPRMAKGRRGIGGRKKPPVKDSISRWASLLDCDEKPKETSEKDGVKRVVYGSSGKQAEVVFITVEGMGHVWPGGNNKLPEWMVGSDPKKFNAADVVWKFFKKHSLAGGK
jgi:polyhydroxybutyrate depolymerase